MSFRWTVGPKTLNKRIVRQPPVGAATLSEAEKLGAIAENDLAGHTDQGHAKIVVDQGTKGVDAFVTLDDSRGDAAALSIEYGHMHGGRGGWERGDKVVWVPGLGILSGAVAKFV